MITESAIEFLSEGAVLRGRLVMPVADGTRRPAVILAHGTSATVEMVMIGYARAFARACLVALAFDHRNLGRSGGEINPWVQCRGYLAALDFAGRRVEIDPVESRCGATATRVARSSLSPHATGGRVPSSHSALFSLRICAYSF